MKRLVVQRVRDDTRDLLRSMIVSGELPPESHVEEIRISEQIGVSRTPVREALIALEHEGLVRSRPRRGFVVVRPNAALVRESYPILAALESAAMRLSAGVLRSGTLRAGLAQLRQLNQALTRERKKSRQYDLDRAFHAALTDRCGNERLLALLNMERARVQLIDGSHTRGMANLAGSVVEHRAIIAALAQGDVTAAVDALARHWHGGIEVVTAWLGGT